MDKTEAYARYTEIVVPGLFLSDASPLDHKLNLLNKIHEILKSDHITDRYRLCYMKNILKIIFRSLA